MFEEFCVEVLELAFLLEELDLPQALADFLAVFLALDEQALVDFFALLVALDELFLPLPNIVFTSQNVARKFLANIYCAKFVKKYLHASLFYFFKIGYAIWAL